jgi:hypothetical protein
VADLPRAYVYAGREADGIRMLEAQSSEYKLVSIARFKMWHGEKFDIQFTQSTAGLPDNFATYAFAAARIHRSGILTDEDGQAMHEILKVQNPRLRATRAQFAAEFYIFTGHLDEAMDAVETAVQAGLQDHLWMQKCPLLDRLRDRPRFAELAAIIADRARVVTDAIAQAYRP